MVRKKGCELILGFIVLILLCDGVQPQCSGGCIALASYFVGKRTDLPRQAADLPFISQALSSNVSEIMSYNRNITNPLYLFAGTRVNVPFSCGCLRDGGFLAHQFVYSLTTGTYSMVAGTYYANLTTVDMLQRFNNYDSNNIPANSPVNVTVNCSCGDSRVSRDYGLFITYPLRPGQNLSSIASESQLPERLLQAYNRGVDFSRGSGLVFIPGRDQNGAYHSSRSNARLSGGGIAGIIVVAVAGTAFSAFCLYVRFCRGKRQADELMQGNGSMDKASGSGTFGDGGAPEISCITVYKSVEFSYEELAKATNDFNLATKIGQGGYGSVFYAELRGQKTAIKKMDMRATKEFLAELNVLTHVHHLNLVCLIGYCIEGSLFLVYEFIENGNLSQHLRGSGMDTLPWSTRIQIALDSARALEYIHEHTIPVYIHRDIKSANILIDKNYHAKVADFGLTKLTEVGGTSMSSCLVGTLGYMPPEYGNYGDISPKVDVYAFGVVLYELISAKEAIVKPTEAIAESKGLVALFEAVLDLPDPKEELCKLVDDRLGEDYPFDSVRKMAELAKACTHENPRMRPSMRSVVVELMSLLSSTEDCDIGSSRIMVK